jgi:hypothetical protein
MPRELKTAVDAFIGRFRTLPRYKDHPFSHDIFCALVGLMPRRMNGKQLWPLLDGQMRTDALLESAFLDNAYLDQETVAQLIPFVRARNFWRRDLFYRLFVTGQLMLTH